MVLRHPCAAQYISGSHHVVHVHDIVVLIILLHTDYGIFNYLPLLSGVKRLSHRQVGPYESQGSEGSNGWARGALAPPPKTPLIKWRWRM
jgi:hypothetical protein